MGFGLFLFLVVVMMEMAPYVLEDSLGVGGALGEGWKALGYCCLSCLRDYCQLLQIVLPRGAFA